ncbi:protein obstructor-E-like [Battus philenor]|uniref:protein obstructor-E-like n=1 Tax=Battus philenor TaxID=42288 RepID=UPI0035D0B372
MVSVIFFAALFAVSCAGEIQLNGAVGDEVCREYNTYYKIQGSCDSYIECNAYKATYKSCPDGLYFVRDVEWPAYPCAYPSDAQCEGNDAPQRAISSQECKHQYGFFASPLASRSDCGKYRMCVEGKAFEMECAMGLAFNPESGRCDWPDLVPSCNAEEFLGFKCPPATYDEFGKAYVVNFSIKGSCSYFFSCMENVARLLVCDRGFAFDPEVNRCVDATRVNCKEGQ